MKFFSIGMHLFFDSQAFVEVIQERSIIVGLFVPLFLEQSKDEQDSVRLLSVEVCFDLSKKKGLVFCFGKQRGGFLFAKLVTSTQPCQDRPQEADFFSARTSPLGQPSRGSIQMVKWFNGQTTSGLALQQSQKLNSENSFFLRFGVIW